MRSLSLWLRRHPVVGDTLLTLLLLMPDLAASKEMYGAGAVSEGAYLLGGLMMLGPLVIRRRRPVLAAYLVLLGGVFTLVTHHEYSLRFSAIALGVMLYTLLAYSSRSVAALYAVWLFVGTLAWASVVPGFHPIVVIFPTMIFVVFWLSGEFVGARRAYHAEVEQRLRLLEHERDQKAKIAVVEERNRIARELHDVVAHAVSVMVVQADGASYALKTDPELAAQALNTISDTGRKALAEMRRLLGVLRSDTDIRGERAPQPDVSRLGDLAEEMRKVGLPVRVHMQGDLSDLPTAVGLSLYRIAQEALTNTLKHAGPGASADVSVQRRDDRVELLVQDDGLGVQTPDLASGGNGLIGMRERVSVYGGTLEAGPRPGGGWQVRAVIPLNGDTPT
ncbi:MAG TPA: sensor histidine kinase [Pseudonocardiaceae bacterium]